ncbi:hypothetical protein BXZ70DRAFT_505329 [Cristinia sonorae]|uniref:BTB domain-containing protein n=1 Tax=Cristinia sonorae TaxID=1940300 RepID=A0A8K0UUK9_9AGAR|nr:hypothetical protein BXZ70DRAFT_505329 [Cristinia sonorae]
MASHGKHTPGPSPFDIASRADFIIRSSDDINFHVYKLIMSISSPIFSDMFEVANPEPVRLGSPPELPFVCVAENSKTLDAILRFLYPNISYVLPQDVSLIRAVLEAARKYELSTVRSAAVEALAKCVGTKPLPVYAIACQYGIEDIARAAAMATTQFSPDVLWAESEYDDELERISARMLRRLVRYRQDCLNAASEGSQQWTGPDIVKGIWCGAHKNCRACSTTALTLPRPTGSRTYTNRYHDWWINYMSGLREKLKTEWWDEDRVRADLISAMVESECGYMKSLHFTICMRQVEDMVRSMSQDIRNRQANVSLALDSFT